MKKYLLAGLLLVPAGCKKTERADNSATRYASSLKDDTVKAREAAEKANQAVGAQDGRMEEAQKQAE